MAAEAFVDALSGKLLQYTEDPRIPICVIDAVRTVQGGSGINVAVNPQVLADTELARAFVEDVRIILDGIEKQYVKEGK